ncbi:MAG: RagB/SusD family nutrient uptake outer membrane protein [Flavobacteriaceae bacterium]|nr:RagB/SusD family nutrient uptake outer membrane protein [Flavobacteriaceae bacterium]
MKKIVKLLSAVTLLSVVSCGEDRFLNTHPTQTVFAPPAATQLNGLYVMMINPETGGTTSHEDFGQKGVDVFTDLLSADMAMSNDAYRRYRNVVNLTATLNYDDTYNYIPWRYYYRLIKAANGVVKSVGGNDAIPTSLDVKHALGQAKAMRAYAYFYLMQLYTTGYNPEEEAIPLYLEAGFSSAPKSKQSVVYQSIEKDLTDAITLLEGFERTSKSMINKSVAQGLLAYTYAAQGKHRLAAEMSKAVMNSGVPISTREEIVRYKHDGVNETGGGFNNLDTNRSWLWGFDLITENGLDLASWWGQIDVFTYSYQWAGNSKQIDETLYKSIKEDDIRKHQFISIKKTGQGGRDYEVVSNDDDKSTYRYVPANKFFAPEREIAKQRKISTDYVFMRVDEFHLLAAESLAKDGNDAEAKSILKEYLKTRITNVDYIDNLSGKELQDEIYKNTRIEFWGEGKSYLAMKRNRATITRGKNHLYYGGASFSYDAPELTFEIPVQEVLDNPYINR